MRIWILSMLAVLFAQAALLPLAFAGTSGPSPIPTPPNFYITSNAAYLCRGQINHIPITVSNGGTPSQLNAGAPTLSGPTMQNVQLSISGSKSVYAIGSSTAGTNNINPGNYFTAMLPVFVTANASSIMNPGIGITYYFYQLYSDTETRNLTFETQVCPSQLSVNLTQRTLNAGNIQNVRINLTNTGATTLSALSVKLSVPATDGVAILSDQPIQVNAIGAGQSMNLNESLYVSRNASATIPLNLTVNFYNGTKLNQIEQNIEMISGGSTNISTSGFTNAPGAPSPGDIFSTSFVLTNIGTATASAVAVTPILPRGFSNYGSNTVFVGDIGADAQTPVTVSINTNTSLKSGTYSIPIKITYLNGFRQNTTTWANTSVTLGAALALNSSDVAKYRTASGGGGFYFLATLILLVIVIVLGVMLYRERKRRSK
ncbi:MAG: hypothetical protein KGH72_03060 [Candidatus Micrarchaeota archaeon]|nr:hypothetical protein [Candidatus Micrarchaeota archaeon]